MLRPTPGLLLYASAVALLFTAPLVYTGESLYWWAPGDASALAWDEAGVRPGTPEYDAWVQAHPEDTPHCTSAGSDPRGSGMGSDPCCAQGGGYAVQWLLWSEGSSCGSGPVGSAGNTGGSEGSGNDDPGSGGPGSGGAEDGGSGGAGAGGGGSGGGGGVGGGGGAGGGGAATPGPGVPLTVLALSVLAAVWRRAREE